MIESKNGCLTKKQNHKSKRRSLSNNDECDDDSLSGGLYPEKKKAYF